MNLTFTHNYHCRQLGVYKKSVRNPRYPEGCIAQQYLMHESVTFTQMYLNRATSASETVIIAALGFNLSVVSPHVEVKGVMRGEKLSASEMFWANWTVIENCSEADAFVESHLAGFKQIHPRKSLQDRVMSFVFDWRRCIRSRHQFTCLFFQFFYVN